MFPNLTGIEESHDALRFHVEGSTCTWLATDFLPCGGMIFLPDIVGTIVIGGQSWTILSSFMSFGLPRLLRAPLFRAMAGLQFVSWTSADTALCLGIDPSSDSNWLSFWQSTSCPFSCWQSPSLWLLSRNSLDRVPPLRNSSSSHQTWRPYPSSSLS